MCIPSERSSEESSPSVIPSERSDEKSHWSTLYLGDSSLSFGMARYTPETLLHYNVIPPFYFKYSVTASTIISTVLSIPKKPLFKQS